MHTGLSPAAGPHQAAWKIRCFVRPPVSWGGGATGDPTCHKVLLGWNGRGCPCEAGFRVARTSLLEARVERGRPGLGEERRRAWLFLAHGPLLASPETALQQAHCTLSPLGLWLSTMNVTAHRTGARVLPGGLHWGWGLGWVEWAWGQWECMVSSTSSDKGPLLH